MAKERRNWSYESQNPSLSRFEQQNEQLLVHWVVVSIITNYDKIETIKLIGGQKQKRYRFKFSS
ncbi:unnamed protein product [Acanthoscelides obtectus]|uniref:Uncharacterized protein n=1 Tax=Acanthoscelides obtectus TaxID=200917 RepID=A0A9P0KI00_ACAOB|nr:unnamed protein product [Acanthoscelides obtectus]CAK1651962.1 hypothetical protein AOBTE_LOCUS17578 [Acanthoscelides obtectus]